MRLKTTLLLLCFFAVPIESIQVDAKILDRLRERRQAKQQPQQLQQQAPNCPDGNCPNPNITGEQGQLTINTKGGFEGQLTDAYYQSVIGPQTPAYQPTVETEVTPTPPAITIVETIAEEAPPIEVQVAPCCEFGTRATAQAAINAARAQLNRAEQAMLEVEKEEQYQAKLSAARMEAEIVMLVIENDRKIEKLRSKLQILRASNAIPTLAPSQ